MCQHEFHMSISDVHPFLCFSIHLKAPVGLFSKLFFFDLRLFCDRPFIRSCAYMSYHLCFCTWHETKPLTATCTLTFIHTHRNLSTHSHTHVHTHVQIHPMAPSRWRTQTHTHIHPHPTTHTLSHIHTQSTEEQLQSPIKTETNLQGHSKHAEVPWRNRQPHVYTSIYTSMQKYI